MSKWESNFKDKGLEPMDSLMDSLKGLNVHNQASLQSKDMNTETFGEGSDSHSKEFDINNSLLPSKREKVLIPKIKLNIIEEKQQSFIGNDHNSSITNTINETMIIENQ